MSRLRVKRTLGQVKRFVCPCFQPQPMDVDEPHQLSTHIPRTFGSDETAVEPGPSVLPVLPVPPEVPSKEGPPVPTKDAIPGMRNSAAVSKGALSAPPHRPGLPLSKDFAYPSDVVTSAHRESPLPPRRSSQLGVDRQGGRDPIRKAVLIGILYTTDNEWETLDTPYQDVKMMKKFLLKNGYQEDCIRIVSDCEDAAKKGYRTPTLEGIREALRWLIDGVRAGDYLFLHYSGHGDQVKADNLFELDGMDEAIVPLRANGEYLKDNELHIILVEPLPAGCRLMAVFDCCHAGTMLDLPYEHEPNGGETTRRGPGGPSNRYQMQIIPRFTFPQLENRIKTVRTVKRSPTTRVPEAFEVQISQTSESTASPTTRDVSVTRTPYPMNSPSDTPVRMGSWSDGQPPRPSRSSTRGTTILPFTYESPVYSRQSTDTYPRWIGSTDHGRTSPDGMSYTSERNRNSISYASPVQDCPKEPLNFFTARADTFALYDGPAEPSAQVIAIAACHDHQSVFEVLPDETGPTKTKGIGGLLTGTFIQFMEQTSSQRTLDDMLRFLSEAFIRETEKIHNNCCRCQSGCDREDCKTPTGEAAERGQCVSPACEIPTFPPNPLVTTLTDKRRQTLITL